MAGRHLQRRVERTKGTAVRRDHQTCLDRCPIARNRRWSGRNGLACGDVRVKWLYRCCCKSPRQHRGRTFIPASRVHAVVGTGEGYFGPHRQVVRRPTVWCSHRPISNRSRRVLAGWVYRVGNGWRQAFASAGEELMCQPGSRSKLQLAPRKLQIGRASCRERGEMSEGGVAGKKERKETLRARS